MGQVFWLEQAEAEISLVRVWRRAGQSSWASEK